MMWRWHVSKLNIIIIMLSSISSIMKFINAVGG